MLRSYDYNPGALSLLEGMTLPFVPVCFDSANGRLHRRALVDSGASVNVLPFTLGLELGAQWDIAPELPLAGNLGAYPAKAIVTNCFVDDFPAKRLAFAWSRSDDVPVILGQTNFFEQFHVCFHGPDQVFELSLSIPS